MNIDKVICIGSTKDSGFIFCHITYKDGRLSITGVEGPKSNGGCYGSCGQIDNIIMRQLDRITYLEPWDAEKAFGFTEVWNAYHLNDMTAGCDHQRAMHWDTRRIDDIKPSNAYGNFFEKQSTPSWNLLGWITQKENPSGLLLRPCPVCGYRYGSKWLRRDIPADVLTYLEALPESARKPAWI